MDVLWSTMWADVHLRGRFPSGKRGLKCETAARLLLHAGSLPFGEARIEIVRRFPHGDALQPLPLGETRIRISYDSHESF